MNDKLKKLYQSVILKHSKEPYQYQENEEAEYQIEAYNPLCGDRFKIYADIKEGKLIHVSFHGYGCAISKAATSVLVKQFDQKSIEEALSLCATYKKITTPQSEEPTINNQELEAFEAARNFPGRLKCATLSWEKMEKFLTEL